MSAVLEIPDAGTITLKFAGSEHTIDAYETWNEIREAQDATDDADEPVRKFHERVIGILAAKGLPKITHFQADQFVTRLAEAVAALKKTAEPTPGSSASTAPLSSTVPPV